MIVVRVARRNEMVPKRTSRPQRQNNAIHPLPQRVAFFSSAGPGRLQQRDDRAGSNAIGGKSSSTERWNDVPRGTMDEVSSHVRLDLPFVCRQGRPKDCSTSSSNPMMEGP